MSTCNSDHETFATILTFGLTVALILSFASQHYKIISKGRSVGFSPWFLLLGSTSSTATMLDIWMLQWSVIKCCRQVSTSVCITSLGGILQVSLQWILFNITFVLFLIYYSPDMKYVKVNDIRGEGLQPHDTSVRSRDWRNSILCVRVTAVHFAASLIYTAYLIISANSHSHAYPAPQIIAWATFLGISSAGAAVVQYLPQLWRTWHFGFVGALSIPMYCFQVPGAGIMVVSIALRRGTDWTSWAMYAASGIMAGLLLLLCLVLKVRQARLGLDDFGRPVSKAGAIQNTTEDDGQVRPEVCADVNEQMPLLDATIVSGDGGTERKGLWKGWWTKK